MPGPQRRSILNNPGPLKNPDELPQGDPESIEAKVLRFGQGLLGDQTPGDLPSALGSVAGLLPLDRFLSFLSKLPKANGVNKAAKLAGPTNKGDKILRNHMLDTGEVERIAQEMKTNGMGEFAPTTVEGTPYAGGNWPRQEDFEALKKRLAERDRNGVTRRKPE